MSFRFRVVPKRRRRGVRQTSIRKAAPEVKVDEAWLESSLIEEKEFRDFPSAIWEGLDLISTLSSFTKGAVLLVQGQPPLGVFGIRKGLVKLSASSADGKSLIVGRGGPGDVLGLPTSISGKANELTAEATQLVECSFITREAFLQFLGKNGSAALSVAHILSHMYDDAFDQIRFLGLSATATAKFARLLLELPAHESPNNGHSKKLPLTHKEIAELIGASRETVTRLFARFKREQLVKINGSRLHILDPAALEQLLTQ